MPCRGVHSSEEREEQQALTTMHVLVNEERKVEIVVLF